MNVLQIDSSILGTRSASRQLTRQAVEALRREHGSVELAYLDLDADPLPHLSGGSLAGAKPAEDERAARVMDQFLAADVLVIGAPMYNFTIPSTLKAWIDRIAVAGKTFRYTANGPEGLATGKRAIVISTTGGEHAWGGPSEHQQSYLDFMLRFLGITDIRHITAAGLARGGDSRQRALAAAESELAAPLARAA
jgi:FMN-dependent NADH-azoreductase